MKSNRRFLPLLLVPGAWLLMLSSLALLVYCGFRFAQFDYPMLRGQYEIASENEVWVTSPEAYFNLGLDCYRQNDYDSCRKAMLKTYAACCDANGKVLESRRRLAARAQLYIGNSYFNLGKTEDAVTAYEEGLRLVPGELYTIYNLEKLQDSQKSGGSGSSGDAPKPGQSKRKI